MEKIPRQENIEGFGNEMESKIGKLREKYNQAVALNIESFFDDFFEFAEKLRGKYNGQDGCQKYAAFHIASGSTFNPEKIKEFDFSGEDSVEKFVDDFLEKELWLGYGRIHDKFSRVYPFFKGNRSLRDEFNSFIFGTDARKGLDSRDDKYQCAAFHVISGSTLDKKDMKGRFLDFEGDDSIETFLDNMLKKVGGSQG
ncbi:MAG: hypothetical protein PHU56_02080 [Candidatus Pacebacteria bacterium]|nr:hypothetical protein [Candidatus Paceibacterota bacterium]